MAAWDGECILGKAEGIGSAKYADGHLSEIRGNFKNGVPHGEVSITYSNGSTYSGSISKGDWDGFGVHKTTWGESYEGTWANGFRDGEGVFVRPDGKRMRGRWERGRFLGSWYAADETTCEVWWSIGSEPTGKLTWSGACINGKAGGSGSIEWIGDEGGTPRSHKVTFDGILVGGKLSGDGEWRETQEYTNVVHEITKLGSWRDGQMWGEGRLVRESRPLKAGQPRITTSYEGLFEDGRYSGLGRKQEDRLNSDGSSSSVVEEGQFVSGSLNGQGTVRRTNNRGSDGKSVELSDGVHEVGQFIGPGTVMTTFETSDGTFSRIVKYDTKASGIGKGTTTFADGDVIIGEYVGNVTQLGKFGTGTCSLKSIGFAGACVLREKAISSWQGKYCLVAPEQPDKCLKEMGGWVH